MEFKIMIKFKIDKNYKLLIFLKRILKKSLKKKLKNMNKNADLKIKYCLDNNEIYLII